MLKFKDLQLEDRELIESYTLKSSSPNCDLSFANMFCWQPLFRSAWCIEEGHLLIRFNIGGGERLGYMQPIDANGDVDFSKLIPFLAHDAHANGDRLRIIGITESGKDKLTKLYGDEFSLHSERYNEDYIYSREALTSLTGKKYQPKRNHINQFTSRYNFSFERLAPCHFKECLEIDAAWREGDLSGAERKAIERGFAHYYELGFIGGVILIENRVAGFTYGSIVGDGTFCINIEKCDTRYSGIYAAINRLFAASLPAEITQINREEDMGIEGLRRAKSSYHPSYLLPKYTAIYLHHDEAQCKTLWAEVFGDESAFIDEFIMHHYSRKGMLSMVNRENNLLSMLHIIPFTSELGRCAYIYGVATHPAAQKRGYSTKLMQAAMEIIKSEGYAFAALIPSQEWLHGYYARFGFSGACPVSFISDTMFDFGSGDAAKDIAMICPIETISLP
ncbi:MAG: GNAT family N-acetyltransferase, partial [Rikenellaceae bacterium]